MHKYAFFVIVIINLVLACSTSRQPRPYPFPESPHTESYFEENDLSFLPDLPPVDPKELKTENLRVTIVMSSSRGELPFIEFDPSTFADYSEYDVCQDDGFCVSEKTLKNQILPKSAWIWPLTIRVRSCVRVKRSIALDENCGPWSIKRALK